MIQCEARIYINISEEDLEDGDGDVVQAIQNILGHTGAEVIEAEEYT
jgi:hypothetical protein